MNTWTYNARINLEQVLTRQKIVEDEKEVEEKLKKATTLRGHNIIICPWNGDVIHSTSVWNSKNNCTQDKQQRLCYRARGLKCRLIRRIFGNKGNKHKYVFVCAFLYSLTKRKIFVIIFFPIFIFGYRSQI